MRIATASLESTSPYSQSRKHSVEKKDKESHDAYEKRTWRDRMHATADGQIFIPPMAFKFCIATAAKYLRMRIPGKDRSEFGKHFQSGVLVTEGLPLNYFKNEVEGEWLSLHANGKRGSGSRVDRCMPRIPEWSGDVRFLVLDDIITEEVFEKHLREAGSFIGIGRFRPENGGFYGRFKVNDLKWSSTEE